MITYIVQYSRGRTGTYSNIFYGTKKRALEVYATLLLFRHNKKRLIAVRGSHQEAITKEYRK